MSSNGSAKPLTSTTRAGRAGIATDRAHGAVVPPIHLSSTFAFEAMAGQQHVLRVDMGEKSDGSWASFEVAVSSGTVLG